MILTSKYWEMVVLTGAGERQYKELAVAREWFQAYLKDDLSDPLVQEHDIQLKLWQRCISFDKDSKVALLCLRCWISHQVIAGCSQLARQFGIRYGFEACELWFLLLNDVAQIEVGSHRAFALDVLDSYDPKKAALSTWTYQKIHRHPEINSFCMEHGLYRISDWALLNDTTPSRLASVLEGCSAYELTEKTTLLADYHRVYLRDRIVQRQQTGRTSRCLPPTDQQLQEMQPACSPDCVLSKLHELANQLRQYTIAVRRKMPPTVPWNITIENQQSTTLEEDENSAESEFIQCYRTHFLNGLDEAIRTVTHRYAEKYKQKKSKTPLSKDQLFLLALKLFHCDGLSMANIAKTLGLPSQVQVTRLLKLKRFRLEICAYWFNQLKHQVKSESLQFITPEKLSKISKSLEGILQEQTNAVMEEAAAEAQTAQKRGTNSKFARRLCAQIGDSEGT